MSEPYTQLFLHLVWATRERFPWITAEVEEAVYGCILRECEALRCEVRAIGGVEDHVHLLVRFPTTVMVQTIVKQVKGSSSHLVTHQLGQGFKWQGGYGAFTLHSSLVPRVEAYITNQKQHHKDNTLLPALEKYAEIEPPQ